jgi:hypothetical protein
MEIRMNHHNDPEQLSIYAEQEFCNKCQVKDCTIFYSGRFNECQPLIKSFEKAIEENNIFLKSLENRFVPGKCNVCRKMEINDKDNNYKMVTIQKTNGKICLHGFLCSVHLNEFLNSSYNVTIH